MAKRIYIYKNKYTWIIVLVVLALIFFLWYYFKNGGVTEQGEKCPDGSAIPSNGDCGTKPVVKDSTGAIIVTPQIPDANGCITVSRYVTNIFPLSLGMKGSLVKALQENLNKYFSAGLKADGYFGCKTLAAVVKNLNVQAVDLQLFNNPGLWTPPTVSLSPNTTGI